jgi:S-DNA-T family DNA segregation ATPase FtsK/SpoIIIE
MLLALASMTLIGLAAPEAVAGGIILLWWVNSLWIWFGWGSVWIVIGLATAGLFVLRREYPLKGERPYQFPWERIFSLEVMALSSLALLSALGGSSLERADAGYDGGRVGWGLSYIVGLLFSPIGLGGNLGRAIISGLVVLFSGTIGLGLLGPLLRWLERSSGGAEGLYNPDYEEEEAVSVGPIQGVGVSSAAVKNPNQRKKSSLPAEFRKRFHIPGEDESRGEAGPAPVRDERLPGLDLLVNEQVSRPDERNINLTAGLIEKTLSEFGIPAKVVGFRIGPTVTQFAVEPGFVEKTGAPVDGDPNRQKVRVAQISALSRDLALALSADRLRIEAPVPGRPYVGIEVPNARSSIVRLRPILESDAFAKVGSPLAIALGRDVSGQPVVADLARMPHLLIAGTTGSGKSVCIAALTTCLVMNNTPEDLRLVMIDPKMVELVRFNGLQHLYGKVETDVERILGVLRWTVAEMDRRYKLLEATHSRNLESYNRKIRRRKGELGLPRIVLLVDELADLMMSAPEQTEPALVRLAQMARATGIHLVIATQRPSTDVVTGLIKANFPARLSFAVASSVDSRVILDTVGAETLLGHGDMLFLPPDASGPMRSQGVLVTDQEVEKVITFWQKSANRQEPESAPWEELLHQESILAERDNLLEQALQIVRETQRASASLLQRRLRIGYPRAARLIDELEEMGVIAPSHGGRDRQVLVDRDEFDASKAQ